MEYISKEARWRAHYRTLPEWVRLIRQASNCSAKTARRQILDGLFDGQFAPSWSDQSNAPFRHDPYDPDLLPREGNFWRKSQINWHNGKVFDGWREEEVGPECWRVLLLAPTLGTVFERILRSSIHASILDVENVVTLHPQPPTSENAHPMRRGRAGRKPGSGSFDDEVALGEMLNLLAAGKEPSVLTAAKAVASAGKANQSAKAEVDRLRRKFANHWGTKPADGKLGLTLITNWTRIESELNFPILNQYNLPIRSAQEALRLVDCHAQAAGR
jgi:hypothetical protein